MYGAGDAVDLQIILRADGAQDTLGDAEITKRWDDGRLNAHRVEDVGFLTPQLYRQRKPLVVCRQLEIRATLLFFFATPQAQWPT